MSGARGAYEVRGANGKNGAYEVRGANGKNEAYEAYVRVKTMEQLARVLEWGKAAAILTEYSLADCSGADAASFPAGTVRYQCLPEILREADYPRLEKRIASLPEETGLVVKNPDELGLLQAAGFHGRLIGDSFLYAYNLAAIEFYLEIFPEMAFLLGDELTVQERKELVRGSGAECICKVYGYQPLMISSQCICRNETGCREKILRFRDEKGASFFAAGNCEQCCSVIYNGIPTWLLDKKDEYPCRKVLLDFTLESGEETRAVLQAFDRGAEGKAPFTRGHFYKGID